MYILWNIEDDKLGLQIHMKEKPLTRRGMLSSFSSTYDPLGLAAPFMLEGRRIIQSFATRIWTWDEQITDSMARQWQHGNLIYYSWKTSR